MKSWPVFFAELAISAAIVYIGGSQKSIWFIGGERSAVITLGIVGMLFCLISVGKFIGAAPASPASILGYLFGSLAMLIFLTQVFRWQVTLISDPRIALYGLAICLLAMGLIARLGAPVLK